VSFGDIDYLEHLFKGTNMRHISATIATLVLTAISSQRAEAVLVWADVTASTSTTFSGTVDGVAFTGVFNRQAGYTNTVGSSNLFSGQPGTFTPSLPASDSLGLITQSGFTLTFAQPIVDPVFDIFSLANTLDFGTPLTLVSGGPSTFGGVSITTLGNQVIGQANGGGADANGTILLTGTFTTITVTAAGTPINDGGAFIFAVQSVPELSSLTLVGVSGLAAGLGMCWRRIWRTA
jgi:hypothetical protein